MLIVLHSWLHSELLLPPTAKWWCNIGWWMLNLSQKMAKYPACEIKIWHQHYSCLFSRHFKSECWTFQTLHGTWPPEMRDRRTHRQTPQFGLYNRLAEYPPLGGSCLCITFWKKYRLCFARRLQTFVWCVLKRLLMVQTWKGTFQ